MWIRPDVHGTFILVRGAFSCLIIASVFYFLTPVHEQRRDFKGSLVAVSHALPACPSFSQLQSSTMNSRLSPTGWAPISFPTALCPGHQHPGPAAPHWAGYGGLPFLFLLYLFGSHLLY